MLGSNSSYYKYYILDFVRNNNNAYDKDFIKEVEQNYDACMAVLELDGFNEVKYASEYDTDKVGGQSYIITSTYIKRLRVTKSRHILVKGEKQSSYSCFIMGFFVSRSLSMD